MLKSEIFLPFVLFAVIELFCVGNIHAIGDATGVDSFFARINYSDIVAGPRYRVKNGSFFSIKDAAEIESEVGFIRSVESVHELENVEGKQISFAIGSKISDSFGIGKDMFLELELSYIDRYDDSIISGAFNVSNMSIDFTGSSGFFNLGYSFFGEKALSPILAFGVGVVSLDIQGIYRTSSVLYNSADEIDDDDRYFLGDSVVEFDSKNLSLAFQLLLGIGIKVFDNVFIDIFYKNLFSFRDFQSLYKAGEILDLSKAKDFVSTAYYNNMSKKFRVEDEISFDSDAVSGIQFGNHIFAFGLRFFV